MVSLIFLLIAAICLGLAWMLTRESVGSLW